MTIQSDFIGDLVWGVTMAIWSDSINNKWKEILIERNLGKLKRNKKVFLRKVEKKC